MALSRHLKGKECPCSCCPLARRLRLLCGTITSGTPWIPALCPSTSCPTWSRASTEGLAAHPASLPASAMPD